MFSRKRWVFFEISALINNFRGSRENPLLHTLHTTHDELFTFRGAQRADPATNNCLSYVIE